METLFGKVIVDRKYGTITRVGNGDFIMVQQNIIDSLNVTNLDLLVKLLSNKNMYQIQNIMISSDIVQAYIMNKQDLVNICNYQIEAGKLSLPWAKEIAYYIEYVLGVDDFKVTITDTIPNIINKKVLDISSMSGALVSDVWIELNRRVYCKYNLNIFELKKQDKTLTIPTYADRVPESAYMICDVLNDMFKEALSKYYDMRYYTQFHGANTDGTFDSSYVLDEHSEKYEFINDGRKLMFIDGHII